MRCQIRREKDDGEEKKEKKVRKERQIKPKAKIDDAEEVDGGAEWKEVKSSHTSVCCILPTTCIFLFLQ